MNTVLLIGSTGQIGTELQLTLSWKFIVYPVTRSVANLTELDTLCQIIRDVKPHIIINAAAYTAVDKAEREPDLAETINAQAPAAIAREAKKLGAFFIHISTDYVFDGKANRPYRETDPTRPINVYGKTKLAGEKAIRKLCPNHLILRTAWVYGSFGKSNFVKTMLKLGAEKEEVRVVADQTGSPTWSRDIAVAITQLAEQISPSIVGTYHFTNSGIASWYDFAVAIFDYTNQLGKNLKVEKVTPITTVEYPTPALRPHYSVLDCAKIYQILGTHPAHWQQSLKQMLAQLHSNSDESTDSIWR
ncbi:MAG: dTDP-4-dehydrorhamnose reductase [Cyanobacteria bacterium P01_A01_bin.84]